MSARELCARTLCLYRPGVPLPLQVCVYSYTGRVPCTGRLACMNCGRTKPEETHAPDHE